MNSIHGNWTNHRRLHVHVAIRCQGRNYGNWKLSFSPEVIFRTQFSHWTDSFDVTWTVSLETEPSSDSCHGFTHGDKNRNRCLGSWRPDLSWKHSLHQAIWRDFINNWDSSGGCCEDIYICCCQTVVKQNLTMFLLMKLCSCAGIVIWIHLIFACMDTGLTTLNNSKQNCNNNSSSWGVLATNPNSTSLFSHIHQLVVSMFGCSFTQQKCICLFHVGPK